MADLALRLWWLILAGLKTFNLVGAMFLAVPCVTLSPWGKTKYVTILVCP